MENETFFNAVFQKPLQAFFHPINDAIGSIDNTNVWKLCAMLLFVLPMLWVWFGLRKEYVNLDAPREGILYDLRVWTVLAMIPHVIFYLVYGA